MKPFKLPFFWRLLNAFMLCGILPLFLLSVVFTGASTRVIAINNKRNLQETVAAVSSSTENAIQTARQLAHNAASDASIVSYCTSLLSLPAGVVEKEHNSILTANILQKMGRLVQDTDCQLFVVPLNGQPVLSRHTIPEEYNPDWYRGWGLFHVVSQNTTDTISSDGHFFVQPHPGSGNDAAGAVIKPIMVNGKITGYVIVDLMRKDLLQRISKTASTQGILDSIYIYDTKTSCIMYSHFSPSEESSFFDISVVHSEIPSAVLHTTEGISVYGSLPAAGTDRYIKDLRTTAMILALLSGFISFMAALLFSRSIAQPILLLTKAMHKVEAGDLSVRCESLEDETTADEMSFLILRFNRMVERIGKQVNDIVNQQRLLRISETKALQAQINPHFLYNTLNSIKSMAKLAGAGNVASMVTQLGRILKNTFIPGEDFMTIEASLETGRCYFEIEAFRWDGRFTLIENIDPRILVCSIPKLVLQPLIENALIHGLEQKKGNGILTICGILAGDVIQIDVIDDGCGIPSEKLTVLQKFLSCTDFPYLSPESASGTVPGESSAKLHHFSSSSNGIALANTHRRLVLLYGSGYGLKITSDEEKGTCVTVRIPFKIQKQNEQYKQGASGD